MKTIYIASPYTHNDPAVREQRYQRVATITSHLIKLGAFAFSPIVHCHPLAVKHGLPGDHAYWKLYNEAWIGWAQCLYIFQDHGWEASVGVQEEIRFAKKANIMIKYSTDWSITQIADWLERKN